MIKKVAIIAGGDSGEYSVSLRSANFLYEQISSKYEAVVVLLRGLDWQALVEWNYENDTIVPTKTAPIDKNDFSYTVDGVKHTIDYAYITIHGTPGENGILQGYFDLLHIPYSTCNTLSASIAFNKYTCNHYLSSFGVRIAKSVLLRANRPQPTTKEIVQTVGLPCFIKSNVGGSSIGCYKVMAENEVENAIKNAFKEGDEVVCERFMEGIEVTCGVYKTKTQRVAFPITEVVPANEFFDYNAKYKGEVQEITPARVDEALSKAVQELTLHIYDLLNCHGIIRVDYILTPTTDTDSQENLGLGVVAGYHINLLEVNITPGMTATSFIPQQVRAAKMNIVEVLESIIEDR